MAIKKKLNLFLSYSSLFMRTPPHRSTNNNNEQNHKPTTLNRNQISSVPSLAWPVPSWARASRSKDSSHRAIAWQHRVRPGQCIPMCPPPPRRWICPARTASGNGASWKRATRHCSVRGAAVDPGNPQYTPLQQQQPQRQQPVRRVTIWQRTAEPEAPATVPIDTCE